MQQLWDELEAGGEIGPYVGAATVLADLRGIKLRIGAMEYRDGIGDDEPDGEPTFVLTLLENDSPPMDDEPHAENNATLAIEGAARALSSVFALMGWRWGDGMISYVPQYAAIGRNIRYLLDMAIDRDREQASGRLTVVPQNTDAEGTTQHREAVVYLELARFPIESIEKEQPIGGA